MENINKRIAQRMRELQFINGFSNKYLASGMDVSEGSVSYYLKGERSIPYSKLEKFCKLCGIELSEFFDENVKYINTKVESPSYLVQEITEMLETAPNSDFKREIEGLIDAFRKEAEDEKNGRKTQAEGVCK